MLPACLAARSDVPGKRENPARWLGFPCMLTPMDLTKCVAERLRPVVEANRHRQQGSVRFRPATWRPWLEPHGATAVLQRGKASSKAGERLISRQDLALLRDEAGADPAGLQQLFVAVMIWGSGVTNGRGPRYTGAALDDPRLTEVLSRTRRLVRSGDLASAYEQFRVTGIGRAFFTKWFAAVDDGSANERALILDSRVFQTLNALGWVSHKVAGTKGWSTRYVTYVRAMHSWAEDLNVEPSWLEWLMFDLSGDVPAAPACTA